MKTNLSFSTVLIRTLTITFALTIILISLSCRSKTAVRELVTDANTKINKRTQTRSIQGAMYHLPLTVVKVAVPMKMKKETPGEFGDFAPCYFSAEEAHKRVTSEKREMSISAPTFDAYGKADLSKTYVIQTTGRYFESRTISATYNKEGVLTEGTVELKDEALPFAIKTAEVVAGLGIKALTITGGGPLGVAGGPLPLVPVLSEVELKAKTESLPAKYQETSCYIRGFQYSIMKIRKKVDALQDDLKDAVAENDLEKKKEISQNIEELQKDQKNWEKRYVAAVKTWNQLQTTPADELPYLPFNIQYDKAEAAFKKLEALKIEREQFSHADLQNINSEIYQVHLKELDDKIKTLTESFLGKGETFDWTGNFEAQPNMITNSGGVAKIANTNKSNDGKFFELLFSYSKNNGICYNDAFKTNLQKNGILVPEEFQFDKCKAGDAELTKVQVYIDRENNDADFIEKVNAAKSQELKDMTSGWYFRIPAQAKVALIECQTKDDLRCADDSKEYGRRMTKIAQYGTTVSLPAKTAGRNSSITVALDETTGALKNFKASSSPAIDKSALDDASKTAQDALNAADPLTKEKRRLDLLKTKNDINDEIKRASNSANSNSGSGNPQP